jgi:hypothetical protein
MELWLIIMTVVAAILLVLFFGRGQNAVWGGATLGVIVGLILALVKHDWNLMALSFSAGTYAGIIAILLSRVASLSRR